MGRCQKQIPRKKAQDIDGATPSYKTIKEEGPDHDKKFTVGVFVGENLIIRRFRRIKARRRAIGGPQCAQRKGWD